MKNYRLKDVHLEKNCDGKIFVAVGGVYDESSNGFKVLSNQEIIDLLNNAIVNSTRENKIEHRSRSSLSDFSTRL